MWSRTMKPETRRIRFLVRILVNRYYNRYRAPEARAYVLRVYRNRAVILFTGHFCRTCGVIDWIEDLTYALRSNGLRVVLKRVRESYGVEDSRRLAIFEFG